MSVHTGQTTIASTNVAQALTTTRTPAYMVIIQNNAGADVRVGDSTVSSTKGHLLKTGGTPPNQLVLGPYPALSLELSQIFINGTSTNVIDWTFVK